jgi:cleavage and polyadenylation specificity factor subunit 2
VLLSHSDVYHVGALPYLVGKYGLLKKAKIFGTLPLVKMGQMTLYDLYQNYENVTDFDVFDLDHVDIAFDSITQLKYSQRFPFKTGKSDVELSNK